MTTHSILPPDVIGEVVDYFGDDSNTLKACSRVSWAWVSHCRSYLFETCVLTPGTIAPFRDLLLCAECTFSTHIRRIRALRCSGSHDDPAFDDIAAVVRGLKDIRELYIEMKLSRFHDDAYPLLCRGFITAFPYATRLDLGFTVEHTSKWRVTAPLFETISFFPALRELHILELSQDTQNSFTTRVPPPDLHSLELRGRPINPILTWLNASNHLRNLDSLTLSSLRNNNAPFVRAALKQIGGALRHLDIDLSNFEADHPAALVLGMNPNLKTLIIRDEPYGGLDEFDPQVLFLVLTSLTASTLEDISLVLDVAWYEYLDWAALDVFLSGTQFPNLRRVVVKCSQHGRHGMFREDYNHSYAYCGALAALGVFQRDW